MSAPAPHGIDDYLEAIYELHEEGRRVLQAEVARRLGVSRPTVSEQISRLRTMGLVEPRGRQIELTEHGASVAEDAVRRHRMAERFLTDVLELPWHLVHEEANRLQGGITEAIQERMIAMLDGPATCPHGNPIPGTGATMDPKLEPLANFVPRDIVVLRRLTEDVEVDTEVLRSFEDHGLTPGARITIVARDDDGSLTIAVGVKHSWIPAALTDKLWVRATADTEAKRAGSTS